MTRVVELTANQEPPQDTQWVLVTSEGWDGAPGEWQIEHHELGATFLAPNCEPDFSDAIQRAALWASQHGIDEIYIQHGRAGAFWTP